MPLGQADRRGQFRFPARVWAWAWGSVCSRGLWPAVSAARGLPPASGACPGGPGRRRSRAEQRGFGGPAARGVASQPVRAAQSHGSAWGQRATHRRPLARRDSTCRAGGGGSRYGGGADRKLGAQRSQRSLLLSAVMPSPALSDPAPAPPSPAPWVPARPAASIAVFFDAGGDVTGRPGWVPTCAAAVVCIVCAWGKLAHA